MFLNVCTQTFNISHVRISQNVKRCFHVKSSTYYFHVKTKMLAYFQICISVSLHSFFLLLVTVVAQFTAETTNSEKAIYFLLLMSCSINKLDFTWKKQFFLQEMVGRGGLPPAPFSLRSCSEILRTLFINYMVGNFLIFCHCSLF